MTTVSVRNVGAGHAVVITRPAELVELSERVYRSILHAGLYVASAAALYSIALVMVQVGDIDRSLSIAISMGLALGLLGAARRSNYVYRRLRICPALWVPLLALSLAAAHVAIGPANQVLFPPTLILVGLLGAALPMRWVILAGLLVALGQASPILLYELAGNAGRALLTAAVADIFVPLLFTALIGQLARFMLELHRTTASPEPTTSPPLRVKATVSTSPTTTPATDAAPTPATKNARLPITPRQMQVLALAAEGITHATIGECLDISPGQVTRLLAHARRRVGVTTTQQLVAWALATGLLPPPPGQDSAM